jgi:CBS domain-containing protein
MGTNPDEEEAVMRSLTVASVMTENVISIRPQTPFKEIVELLVGHRISAVPVVDGDGAPVGVVSEADLVSKEEFEGGTDPMPLVSPARRRRWRQAAGLTAADVMHHELITVAATDKVQDAARKLVAAGVRRLFVVDDDGRLVGVLSRRDLLTVYLRSDEQLADEITNDVLRASLWIDGDAVQVEVIDGVVTLTGTLPRRSDAETAVRLVQAQLGVVGVVDNLRYEYDDIAATRSGAVRGPA